MLENLLERGCELYGIKDCPDEASQEARLREAGFETYQKSVSMDKVYQRHLDATERRRIECLEMFDEFEEWILLQSHYCLAWAGKSAKGVSLVL